MYSLSVGFGAGSSLCRVGIVSLSVRGLSVRKCAEEGWLAGPGSAIGHARDVREVVDEPPSLFGAACSGFAVAVAPGFARCFALWRCLPCLSFAAASSWLRRSIRVLRTGPPRCWQGPASVGCCDAEAGWLMLSFVRLRYEVSSSTTCGIDCGEICVGAVGSRLHCAVRC